MKHVPVLVTVAALGLAACAKSPESIAPVSMGNAFQSTSCSQAHAMLQTERQQLAALSSQQRSAVTGDAIGVFLIGVPTSSLTGGDVAGELGATKGKVVALENRLMRC